MRSVLVGTAGHVDHGKTALVRALTGIDCDRLEEEKRRGITLDLGFAHLSGTGSDPSALELLSFRDLEANVRAQVDRLANCLLLPPDIPVTGFVYEVETGRFREIASASTRMDRPT